jgi:hypothetical protein
MDLCYRIVDAVKSNLKMDRLEVKLNPVTSATRIPLIANGTVDAAQPRTTSKGKNRSASRLRISSRQTGSSRRNRQILKPWTT